MLSKIKPATLSYLIGFLQGDGSYYTQSRNRGKITIELSVKDKDIIDKIITVFESIGIYVGKTHRLRTTNFKKSYESCGLSIYNKKVRSFLSSYLPSGHKHLIIKPPTELYKFDKNAYIRGLTDADGSLGITSNNRAFWSLCASSEHIKDFILKDIKKELEFEKRLDRNKRDDVYNIVLYDEDAINYTMLIYNNQPFLERKYNNFQKVQNWKRSIPKRKGRQKRWLLWEDTFIVNSKLSIQTKSKILNRSIKSINSRLWRLKQ
jgi:hypothetical protein